MLIFLSVGLTVNHTKQFSTEVNSSIDPSRISIQIANKSNKITEIDTINESERVFIKKNFEESQGSAYYVLVVLSNSERININSSKGNYFEFWKNEILRELKEFSIEEEINNSIKSILTSNQFQFDENTGMITILTSSANYDSIEVQVLSVDGFAYSITVKYYSPL